MNESFPLQPAEDEFCAMFTAMVNVSTLYNAVGMQNFIVNIIVITLALKYNHRNKTIWKKYDMFIF